MHSIFIEDLEVETIVGAYAEERMQPQILTINVEIGLATFHAFQSDKLKDTIDYAAVASLIQEELARSSFKLLERLVEHLCECIEARFEISHIRMRVAKSGIVPGARQVGVSISRAARPSQTPATR